MTIFCNQCGTKNEETGAAFCDHCGAPLRKPVASQAQPQTAAPHRTAATPTSASHGSKKALYASAALLALLVIGGGAAYFAMTPPDATSSRLLAAAKKGYGQALDRQYKLELCLSNMNYSGNNVNVAEYDQGTQTWLNSLATAGLYSPGVPVSSGGYFPQTLIQYVATPELAKWRDGARLCLAKEVEITDVVDIEKPQEEVLGGAGKGVNAKLLTVKAKLLLRATNIAPWLETTEVQTAALAQIGGWEFKNAELQKQIPDTFGLREGQWTTGPAYKAEVQKQYLMSQRASQRLARDSVSDSKGFFSSLGDTFSGLFSFGSHPLKGSWRMDTDTMGRSLGMGLPAGLGLDVTMRFKSDTMEMGGQSVKCKFEVDGKRVKVTPEGQIVSLIFVMQDPDTASVDMGLFKVQYKRVD